MAGTHQLIHCQTCKAAAACLLPTKAALVGEHEASRRMKTEMLVQMDGCNPALGSTRVLLVGATNRPEVCPGFHLPRGHTVIMPAPAKLAYMLQELDEAARRRMPKQLYIPLPCANARKALLARHLGPRAGVTAALSEADTDKLVARTQGYSGSDMRALIQEACQVHALL